MDPSHGNWLHHSCGLRMNDSIPMEADPISSVSLKEGFSWTHKTYSKKYVNLKGKRTFKPQGNTAALCARVEYEAGPLRCLDLIYVPVEPGISRVIAPYPKPKSEGWKAKMKDWFLGHGPLFQPLLDQDHVMNGQQTAKMAAEGLTSSDYVAFAAADIGVTAMTKWLQQANYDGIWKHWAKEKTEKVNGVDPHHSVSGTNAHVIVSNVAKQSLVLQSLPNTCRLQVGPWDSAHCAFLPQGMYWLPLPLPSSP